MIAPSNGPSGDHPGDRLQRLGATIFRVLEQGERPDPIARIVRLWSELREADPKLALELACKLPMAEIRRSD